MILCTDVRSTASASAPYGLLDQCTPDMTLTSGTGRTVDLHAAAAGEITGTVTAAADGSALPGGYVIATNTATGKTYEQRLGSSPSYSIVGVPAGAYRVCVDAAGAEVTAPNPYSYVDTCLGGTMWVWGQPAVGSTVTVTAGNETGTVDFALADGGAISGRVVDAATGNGADDIQVEAYDASGTLVGHAYSGADVPGGSYTILGLPPSNSGYTVCFDGTNSLDAHGDRYTSACWRAHPWHPTLPVPAEGIEPVTVSADAIHSGVDEQLAYGNLVEGSVTDAGTGKGVAGATVTVVDPAGTVIARVPEDTLGSWFVHGLPNSTSGYRFCIAAPGYHGQCYSGQSWDGTDANIPAGATAVPVTAGTAPTHVDVALPPS